MLITFKKTVIITIFCPVLITAFAVFLTACKADIFGASNISGNFNGGNTTDDDTPDEYNIFITEPGDFTPLTLGLTPGNDTTEMRFNWYTSGNAGGKVAQVRISEVIINEETAEPEESAPEIKDGTVDTASSGYSVHRVTVTGLEPGSYYKYSVSHNGTDWSDTYRFRLPPPGAFRFAAVSDPQITDGRVDGYSRYPAVTTRNADAWAQTMQKIAAVPRVRFIANMGDQVDNNSNTRNEPEYEKFFAPPGLRSLPFASTVGNHDSHSNFFNHFNLPNLQFVPDGTTAASVVLADMGNYYYRYNNVLFVVLNTGVGNPNRNAAQQYITKFRQVLETAKTAHAGQYDWLIVQHHKSTASVANHVADSDIQAWVEAGFETLMSEQDVDFVLAGHDHVYARSYPLQGMDDGKVSLPDKTSGMNVTTANAVYNGKPGNPIYITFTTASGVKYYQVSADKTFNYNDSITTNTSYPYLSADEEGNAGTMVGSASYKLGNLPVSNAVFVQPWIPSYCIVDVTSTTISFKTYPIGTKSGQNSGAQEPYSFDENTPYDSITVNK